MDQESRRQDRRNPLLRGATITWSANGRIACVENSFQGTRAVRL